MILRFPYLPEALHGPPPPSMPNTATVRWRPLVPITIFGSDGTAAPIARALLDCGADDTIFPLAVAQFLGVPFVTGTGHAMRWRGQRYAMQFGRVILELTDQLGSSIRWHATVAFSAANMRYPLLGMSGCLEFLDANLLGRDRAVEVEPNASCPSAP